MYTAFVAACAAYVCRNLSFLHYVTLHYIIHTADMLEVHQLWSAR